MTPSVTANTSPAQRLARSEVTGLGVSPVLTAGANPVTTAIASENDLLACLETRLANEVSNLADALLQFNRVAQSVREELPLTSDFGKRVTLFFSLSSLHVANALLQRSDAPLLVDDGAQQLSQLGLSLKELFVELDLNGRRFLAVALPDQGSAQILQG